MSEPTLTAPTTGADVKIGDAILVRQTVAYVYGPQQVGYWMDERMNVTSRGEWLPATAVPDAELIAAWKIVNRWISAYFAWLDARPSDDSAEQMYEQMFAERESVTPERRARLTAWLAQQEGGDER